MNIKDLYVCKENFKKDEKYEATKGEKIDRIISGVITGIMVASLVAVPAFMDNNTNVKHNTNFPTEIVKEEQTSQTATIHMNLENPEIIKERSSITIIDSKNVIAAYMTVTSDGLVGENDMLLHPNEDYIVIVRYNGQEKEISFHTNSETDMFNLTVDYINGSLELTQIKESKTL